MILKIIFHTYQNFFNPSPVPYPANWRLAKIAHQACSYSGGYLLSPPLKKYGKIRFTTGVTVDINLTPPASKLMLRLQLSRVTFHSFNALTGHKVGKHFKVITKLS